MKSQLEELYLDSESLVGIESESEKSKKLYYEYDKLYLKFKETLNGEQQKMLDELCCLMNSIECENNLTNFKSGFKFCMRLCVEGLSK